MINRGMSSDGKGQNGRNQFKVKDQNVFMEEVTIERIFYQIRPVGHSICNEDKLTLDSIIGDLFFFPISNSSFVSLCLIHSIISQNNRNLRISFTCYSLFNYYGR